jgi:hypothetical protein
MSTVINGDRRTVSGTGGCRLCGNPVTPGERGRPSVFCDSCRKTGGRTRAGSPARGDTARFSRALRDGMKEHGFTLRSLARYTSELGAPVSLSALAKWVDGRSAPADPLDSPPLRALELAFERDIGDLSLLFEPSKPATERTSQRIAQRPLTEFAGGLTNDSDGLHAAADELQDWIRSVTGPQRVLVQKVGTETTIDVHRRLRSTTSTLTVRAMHDLVDCYFFMHAFTAGAMPEVVAEKGCEVSPRKPSNHPQLKAVELIFPEPLDRGDKHSFSFTVHYPETDDEPTFYARAFPSPLAEVALGISFAVAPQQLNECRWALGSTGSGKEIESRTLPPGSREAAITLSPPRPAGLGWTWTW